MSFNLFLSLISLLASGSASILISNTTSEHLKKIICASSENNPFSCDSKLEAYLETNVSYWNGGIELICRSNSFLSFTWSRFSAEESYLIEIMEQNSSWTFHEKVTSNWTLASNLTEGSYYQIRLWRIDGTKNQVFGVYSSEMTKTYASNEKPLPVKTVAVKHMEIVDDFVQVTLSWTPGKDRSCFYEVLWVDDAGDSGMDVNVTLGLFEAVLSPLEIDGQYVAFVMAKSEQDGMESGKTKFEITMPTCLSDSENFTLCKRPDPPINLKAHAIKISKNVYNVEVTWAISNATIVPDYYILELTVILDEENFTNTEMTVPGDKKNVVFENIEILSNYEIYLFAVIDGNRSKPIIVEKHVQDVEMNLKQLWIIVLPIVVIIICLFVTINFLVFTKRKKRQCLKKNEARQDQESKHHNGVTPQPMKVPKELDEWETDLSRLTISTLLGNGAFGIVRKGLLQKKDGSYEEVAVKTLTDNSTEEDKKQFLTEIEIMKSVGTHRHLVSLLGCNTTDDYLPILIVEYCSHGDLKTYLQNAWNLLTEMSANQYLSEDEYENLSKNISNKLYDIESLNTIPKPVDLLSFARQIAMGMEYLSSLHVLHRDLAARNVLISKNGIVKVSDFGLSRDVYRDNVYYKSTSGKLPIRWMAIESLTHQIYTSQSDVWSFGILVWEIVTLGANPYPGVTTQELLTLLETGYRMEKPKGCRDDLYDLMGYCWKKNPKERPTFTTIKKMLDNIMEDCVQYLLLDKMNKYTNCGISSILEKSLKEDTWELTTERYVTP